ncbi:hypothetical protein DM860_003909 [Cuscuta australis]|uniref:Uncharacterized protein n=1 Tax=Cuscuta australis TaxID=267555 RepID=A0A328CUT9_9ASTE|nr:hypothetical protein DM860_003909 [Cuscuta australis]
MDRNLEVASMKKKNARSSTRETKRGENRGLGLERDRSRKTRPVDKNSITVSVEIGSRMPEGVLRLDGFKSSDTISDVKVRACQTAKDLGLGPLKCCIRSMMSLEGRHLEDNQTLASLYRRGCSDSSLFLFYFPGVAKDIIEEPMEEMRWLRICKLVRFTEEAHENNWVDEEEYYKGSYDEDDPVSIEKRPKFIHAPLPFAQVPNLCIHGRYELLDILRRPISFSKIRHTHCVATTASVVFLALNDRILKDLVSLNTKSEYLVIRVSWDKLSYVFVRVLRKSNPDIPIVAVTDLDPHHLDLLTFLDTPPDFLPSCYGWDLTRDFGQDVCASSIDFVDIKWLGLRPFDYWPRHTSSDGASRCPGFDKVIGMLRANPFLRRKKEWLEALDWLDLLGECVSLHLLAPPLDSGAIYLGDDYIPKKVCEKDWV